VHFNFTIIAEFDLSMLVRSYIDVVDLVKNNYLCWNL